MFFCFVGIPGVEVGTGLEGIDAGEQAGARGAALRRVAVGLGEEHAAGGEGVDVRRTGVGMAAETTQPVIQIIHDDEDNVGSWFFLGPNCGCCGHNARNDQQTPDDECEWTHR